AALWASHPLVHDPGGTAEGVLGASPHAALEYRAAWHAPSRLLVVAAGACEPADFGDAVDVALGSLPADLDRSLPVEPDTPPRAEVQPTPPKPLPMHDGLVHLAVGVAV